MSQISLMCTNRLAAVVNKEVMESMKGTESIESLYN